MVTVKKTPNGTIVLASGQPIVAVKNNRCKVIPFGLTIDFQDDIVRDLVKIVLAAQQQKHPNSDKLLTAIMELGIDKSFEVTYYGCLKLTSIKLSDKQLNEL